MFLRTYADLIQLQSFEERFEYLKLGGVVGRETFGLDRYLNQLFYQSDEWRSVRDQIIVRDNGCDLGMKGFEIHGPITVHHINPLSQKDILEHSDLLLNPNYLISTTASTHKAVHYGDKNQLLLLPNERSRNDTCPWRKGIS